MFSNEEIIESVIKEAAKKYSPKSLAKELGINLTPENAAEIVKKYLNASIHEAKGNSKVRQLAAIAGLIALGFINAVQAEGPITVKTPFGEKTYEAKDLKKLQKTDAKTFAIIMEMAQKQQNEKKLLSNAVNSTFSNLPSEYAKTVKSTEVLSDKFGNEGTLTTFIDGTKALDGDILHGGVSLRQKLEQKGELVKGGGDYAQLPDYATQPGPSK